MLNDASYYKAIWRWHAYAGLFCIPFVVILSVSGLIYLFKEEFEDWTEWDYNHLHLAGNVLSAETLIQEVMQKYPAGQFMSYELARDEQSAVRILIEEQDVTFRLYVHPESGAVLGSTNEKERFMRTISRLHGELWLGNWGSMIVELASSWTVVLILSGMYLWWPRQSRSWAGVLYPRMNNQGRVFWRDLHSVVGFWCSLFTLFLLLSGMPWAKFWGDYFKQMRRLTGTAVVKQDWSNGSAQAHKGKLNSGHDSHEAHINHTYSSIKPLDLTGLNQVVSMLPQYNLVKPVILSPVKSQSGTWKVQSQPANRPLRSSLLINGVTGEVLKYEKFKDRHYFDQLVGYGIAAHEGRLFGWINQALGLFTALGLVTLSVAGVILWWKRRHVPTVNEEGKANSLKLGWRLGTVLLSLCLLLPLFGISFVVVYAIDRIAYSIRAG